MTTSVYPNALDAFTAIVPGGPGVGTPLAGPGASTHSTEHNLLNDAVLALETKVGRTGSTDTSSLDFLARRNVVAKSAAYTALVGDIVLATATAAFTVTLPVAAVGAQVVVKKIDASANAVTVATQGGATIDGASTKVLSTQWAFVKVVSDGTGWFTV